MKQFKSKSIDCLEHEYYSDITGYELSNSVLRSHTPIQLGCEIILDYRYGSGLGDHDDLPKFLHLSVEETKRMLELLFQEYPNSETLIQLKENDVF